MKRFSLPILTLLAMSAAVAEPVRYDIDPNHTFPSFEADHMGGLSLWRGKFKTTSGSIVLDRQARTGSLEITIDTASIDFGHERLNTHARAPDIFDVEKFPTATYKGRFTRFAGDVPQEVQGELTLHGVTRPVILKITQFLCKPHPVTKREVCGADASADINRADFGINYGEKTGFNQAVKLLISVEARRAQ